MNQHVACVIQKDGSFVVGDKLTGLTSYSYPDSPNAVRAFALRGGHSDLLRFGEKVLNNVYPGTEGPRSLTAFRAYHARNWMRLNEDPRKWNLGEPPKLVA